MVLEHPAKASRLFALPKNSCRPAQYKAELQENICFIATFGAPVFSCRNKGSKGNESPFLKGLGSSAPLGKVLRKPRSTGQPAPGRALERLSAEGQHQGHCSRTTASALPSALGPRSCRAIKAHAGREQSLLTGRSCTQALQRRSEQQHHHNPFLPPGEKDHGDQSQQHPWVLSTVLAQGNSVFGL